MKNETSIRATIVNALGLHARSAVKIAELARHAKSTVWVCKGEARAEASDILEVIALQCPLGTELTLCVDDRADSAVLSAIADLIASGFGESTHNE